ncbi:MAG: cytochrome c oxidase subunit II [Alphaproteobacteria bacterium]|nr:MAG: cytochrome c oxidase subunit II [Alphaproteobacteria bacterium]
MMTRYFSAILAFLITALPLGAMAQDGYAGSWQLNMQEPVSPILREIGTFHDLLLWIITVITVIVTALMLYACFKYRRKKGVKAADFAHNTVIEIIWTIIPIVILIVIAIPSFTLLYFEDRIPEPELTIKTTGYQWYWGYEYTDYDDLEFLAYPIADVDIDESKGQRRLLSTDNPVVVPVDTNIQILIAAADVLHAFAVPAAGVKKDAVPGQLNETWMRIEKEGTYFGQCSEICGAGHSYMPIEIKAVSKEAFNAWAKAQGGKLKPKTTLEDKGL